ncbi:MAG: DUF4390 domain-containing protein [Acidimicrobiia bacterium]|nr:DUF4390 domain-containing protein [Acidimicrobiia bacterium]
MPSILPVPEGAARRTVTTRRGALAGVLALVLAATVPLQAADSIRVIPLARDGVVLVSFGLDDTFSDDVRAAAASGLRTTVTYTVELRLEVPFWIDRTIASTVVSNTVQYDNLTRRATVTRTVDGRLDDTWVTDDEATLRTWLTTLQRFPLFETSRLEPNREYYIRVSARTQPKNGSLPWSNPVSGFAKFTFIP